MADQFKQSILKQVRLLMYTLAVTEHEDSDGRDIYLDAGDALSDVLDYWEQTA